MPEEKMARPQLYIPDRVWHTFRQACLAERRSASKVVEELMRQQLAQWGWTLPDGAPRPPDAPDAPPRPPDA